MNDSVIQQLSIKKIISATSDARTFVLEPINGWKPSYRSGQFITLVFYTTSGEKRRSYSISSSPELGEPLAITVKKVDNGEFSRWLIYKAKEGDVLYSSGISGFFVLPENGDEESYCFLAAGSGITPCFALIKTILYKSDKNAVLLFSNRSRKDAIFYEEIKQLEQEFKERFAVHFIFSDQPDVLKRRLSFWLLAELLDQHIPHPLRPKTIFYLCGPYEYMLMASITLKNNGVSPSRIIKEDFDPLPILKIPQPPDTETHTATIHIGGKTYQFQVQYPQSITKAAKANHVTLPYSCEAGRCGSCVATCIAGKIWMAYNEVLMDDEIAAGKVLTCVGFPVGGDVEIQF